MSIWRSGYCCDYLIDDFKYNFYDYKWWCKWLDLKPSHYESLQTYKRLMKALESEG